MYTNIQIFEYTILQMHTHTSTQLDGCTSVQVRCTCICLRRWAPRRLAHSSTTRMLRYLGESPAVRLQRLRLVLQLDATGAMCSASAWDNTSLCTSCASTPPKAAAASEEYVAWQLHPLLPPRRAPETLRSPPSPAKSPIKQSHRIEETWIDASMRPSQSQD